MHTYAQYNTIIYCFVWVIVKVILLVGCFVLCEMMLNYLRGTSKVFGWIRKYPKTSALTGVLLASPLIDPLLNMRGHYQQNSPVYAKLLKGSCPDIPLNLKPVFRPDIAIELTELFFKPNDKAKRFGVVIGPSGSGKTTAISELCNKSPYGV